MDPLLRLQSLPPLDQFSMVESFWDIPKAERKYNWNHRAGEYSSLRAVGISGNGKYVVTVEGFGSGGLGYGEWPIAAFLEGARQNNVDRSRLRRTIRYPWITE